MKTAKGTATVRAKRDNRFAWAFFLPTSVYMFVFAFLPLLFVLGISLTDWNGMSFSDIQFLGFDNFVRFFTDSNYLRSLGNTVIMGVCILVLTMVIGFFLALLLNGNIWARGFHRVAWYIPGILSFAVISQLFSSMLLPDGIINVILYRGFGIEPIAWKASTFWMFFWIIVISLWRGLGGTVLLYLAGLTGISPELYEAAQVEGCNRWQKTIYITLPMLRPMIGFILITSMINMFNIFEPVLLISEGGPEGSTKVIMYLIYDEAFGGNNNMGMSCTASTIVLVLVMILTVINLRMTKLNI